MTVIRTQKELNELAELYANSIKDQKKRVLVCAGTGCVASGSLKIMEKMQQLVKEKGLLVDLKTVIESQSGNCLCE